MLFDGLMACLADAEGHFERNDIKGKHESIGKATKILVGLQSALDFEEGKELAANLSDLYDYCVRRLLKANIRNDIDGIKEVRSLIQEVKGAWEMLPQILNKDVKVSMVS
jgi:flagellar protein FliS